MEAVVILGIIGANFLLNNDNKYDKTPPNDYLDSSLKNVHIEKPNHSDIYDLIFEGYIFKKDLEIYDKETNNVINIKNTITLPLINKVYIGDIRDTETNIRYIETPTASNNAANSKISNDDITTLNNTDLRATFIESIRQAENSDKMYQIRVKNE